MIPNHDEKAECVMVKSATESCSGFKHSRISINMKIDLKNHIILLYIYFKRLECSVCICLKFSSEFGHCGATRLRRQKGVESLYIKFWSKSGFCSHFQNFMSSVSIL